MGRPLPARPPNPGHSAAHPLNQQGVDGATAEHLLAHGKDVRALVRNREKASSWANQGVELVDGDWNDPAAIERALKGVEGTLSCCQLSGRALARLQRS
jgi:uncharacterized protein YbjT (DUF2867 family)